jgi:hypothetical protein
MREVDFPSIVLIDVDIPTLTPGPYSVEAALEFSENVTLLTFCRIKTGVVSKETYSNSNY